MPSLREAPMQLGVCYYPEHWPREMWADDARRMAALGLRVARIGEFAWARMQPHEDAFDWDWLDQAIATLHGEGLQVVLGTPTAAPPHWLVREHPEILARDAQGRVKGFGARRHYDFASPVFREAALRIVEAMAARYGRHPAVVAWQTDNEYGCMDTVLSTSPAALAEFRRWLAQRYGDIGTLNQAWGNVFWSMDYPDFEAVGFPVDLPAQTHPNHLLDWRRCASDAVLDFNRAQVEILRRHAPGKPVLHNFMGFFDQFDQHAMGADLDIAAWDSYPLGVVDTARFITDDERLRWRRTGHPDAAAFNHDLYRGLCHGRMWVMEQQAGPVNWANWNPAPLPGMVRTWTWEALAHGAELVSYFRWRQYPRAQEQLHSGLNTPDNRLDIGGQEAAQVAAEIERVQAECGAQPVQRAAVALLHDYPSRWMTQIQPHGADFDHDGEVFAWYRALRGLGLDVDILGPEAALDGYALVVLPLLVSVDAALVQRLQASGAQVVFGPRCGSRTAEFALPATLPPGPLAALVPMRVDRIESLRPGVEVGITAARGGTPLGHALRWRDLAEPGEGVVVEAHYADGRPAVLRHGQATAVTGVLDDALLRQLLGERARAAGLATTELPEGLRLRRRGTLQFAIHYGPGEVDVPAPADADFVLGQRRLGPAQVAAWRIA